MVLARTSKAAGRLSAQFRERQTQKMYLAVVEGRLSPPTGEQTIWLIRDGSKSIPVVPGTNGAKSGSLAWRTLETGSKSSLVEIDLHTGRRHQIRAQMASLGHPLLGDLKYGSSFQPRNDSLALFCMNAHGQYQTHSDIYILNIYDSTLTQFNHDPQVWDEHAHYTPDGEKIIWISSEGLDFDSVEAEGTLRTEYWIMNADGTDKTQLTFFNDPTHPDFDLFEATRIICGDVSLSITGDSLLMNIKVFDDTLGTVSENIMLGEFNEEMTAIETMEPFPTELTLHQNYPNPFNPETTIYYDIPYTCHVTVRIFNLLGQEVTEPLVDQEQSPGTYEVQWHADKQPSGVYFMQINAHSHHSVKRMLLLK